MSNLTLGQRSKFIEHAATLNDLDSLMSFTEGVMWREGIEDVEKKTERRVMKEHGWMFAGNTVEAEYAGTTGRTAMAEVVENITGKLIWRMTEELTPREMDFEEMSKFD